MDSTNLPAIFPFSKIQLLSSSVQCILGNEIRVEKIHPRGVQGSILFTMLNVSQVTYSTAQKTGRRIDVVTLYGISDSRLLLLVKCSMKKWYSVKRRSEKNTTS
jgi:hypothetical protein